jgi:integrase
MNLNTTSRPVPPELSAPEVRDLLNAKDELAFLNVREEGVFNSGHAFHAVSAPMSHLETRLPKLVPRKDTRVVLMDGGDEDLARRSFERLMAWGYTDVYILRDGLRGWTDAGFPAFRSAEPEYLDIEEVTAILRQPDRSTVEGQRDHTLLAFLYNTGARIQEALSLCPPATSA